MNISPINQNNFSAAVDLLKKNNLPTDDLTDTTLIFALLDGDHVSGTIGLEHEGEDALLRSLSVSEEKRRSGLGMELVRFIEQYAKENGVKNIYLLTTTAAPFFSKLGYEVIDRNSVSGFVRKTSEYCSVCPASATVMKKTVE
jgi:amino-acid N-acetyltransferase